MPHVPQGALHGYSAHRDLIIAPRLRLPAKRETEPITVLSPDLLSAIQRAQTSKRRLVHHKPHERLPFLLLWRETNYMACALLCILFSLLALGENPVYLLVACIVTVILWSNIASHAIRAQTRESALALISTLQVPIVRLSEGKRKRRQRAALRYDPARLDALTQDTTTYLVALRHGFLASGGDPHEKQQEKDVSLWQTAHLPIVVSDYRLDHHIQHLPHTARPH